MAIDCYQLQYHNGDNMTKLYMIQDEDDNIFTSEIAQSVLKGAKIVENPALLSLNGITIACAKASDRETAADFVLFHGNSKRTENSAGTAIYFANSTRVLPENAVNIRANRDFSAPLDGEELRVKIEKSP